MKTSFVSTPAFANALRLSMRQTQADLFTAQRELASYRHDDVGLELGNKTGLTVTLRQRFERLGSITDTNAVVTARVESTQVTLDGMLESANEFLQSIIAARDANSAAPLAKEEAAVALEGLINGLNISLGGDHLFAGINVDQSPVADYFGVPAEANKVAVDNAFAAAFGFSQDDPNVATIGDAALQTFLDNDFAALFEEAQWAGTWSSASSIRVESRISTSETVETSATANEEAFRKLAEAYTMIADLGTERLSASAYETLMDTAIVKVGEAVQDLTAIKARLGTAEMRLAKANDRMSLQSDILERQIAGLENIDPYEASSKVSQLTSQVEIAYALTARMQRLGLMQYL